MYYKLTFCVRNHLSCSSSRDSVSKIYIPTHPSRPSLCHSQFFAPWWKPTPRCLLHPAHWIRQMNIDFFSPSFTVSCVYFVPLLQQAVSHLRSSALWTEQMNPSALHCIAGGVGWWGGERRQYVVTSEQADRSDRRTSAAAFQLPVSLFFFLSSPQNSKSWQQWQACYWKPGNWVRRDE